jgi:putative NADPH-quinone reductase
MADRTKKINLHLRGSVYMKTLIIVAHPDLQASRINRAWVEELSKQENVTVHSLYNEYPSGAIDVKHEQELLDSHDRVIFQYPFYFYSTPPLLTQWFNDVLEVGWAFGPGGDHMRGKQIGIAISTGGTAAAYQDGGHNLFTIQDLTKPMASIANYVHADYLPLFVLHGVNNVTDEELAASRAAYVNHLAAVEPGVYK